MNQLLLLHWLYFYLSYRKIEDLNGEITYIYLIVYSFARMFIEGIRTDSLMLGNYRISQIISIIIFVVFCIIFAKNIIEELKQHRNHEKRQKM